MKIWREIIFLSIPQNIFNKQNENMVLSPFLVKLMLSILSEAAGEGTSTHRELASVSPIQSTAKTRELYGEALGSMLVSLPSLWWDVNRKYLFLNILQRKNPNYKFNAGTRLYVDRFIQPGQRFQAIIKTFYYSGT